MTDLDSCRENQGWRQARKEPSLPEVHRSVGVPQGAGIFRKFLAFAGPGFLVAVGYMDPGNWATDIAAGSQFNYTLLSVIMISNLMALLLQALAVKLGIATGRDLAQACRDHFSRPVGVFLWLICEVAIAACDLAEVIGSAIALQLLFHIPLIFGVLITVGDVLLLLYFQTRGFRYIEALVLSLVGTIGVCFCFEILLSKPQVWEVMNGFVPTTRILTNPEMLYLAVGILGATVMPHNLYLHSSIVQTRKYELTSNGKREAIRYAIWDSHIALLMALFINAAILVMSATVFYRSGNHQVADIFDAHKLLAPLLGTTVAGTLFAVALLASGQNSTLTGTIAGQIVMEGFLNLRLRPWLRRLITRLIAVVPAVVMVWLYGEGGATRLLLLSQVILSFQLSFAVFPLVYFTSDVRKMGEFVNSTFTKMLAWSVAILIAGLNIWLLIQTLF